MGPAPDIRRIHTFRRWAPLFDVLDHESGPTSTVVVAAGSFLLAGLALAEDRPAGDATQPTLVAFLALAALAAALVMAVGEAAAWLLARSVGRDVARAAASLERARIAVARIGPMAALDEVGLAQYAERVTRSAGALERRLTDADAAVVGYAALREPGRRASRLGLLLAEGRAITDAAESLDAVSHLLRWIAACPWSPLRPEALSRLSRDLGAAERLAAGSP